MVTEKPKKYILLGYFTACRLHEHTGPTAAFLIEGFEVKWTRSLPEGKLSHDAMRISGGKFPGRLAMQDQVFRKGWGNRRRRTEEPRYAHETAIGSHLA